MTAIVQSPPRPAAVVSVFYLVTMVGAGLLGVIQPVLGVDPVVLELVQFGPLLGVVAVAAVWAGRWRPAVVTGVTAAPRRSAALLVPTVVVAIFGLVLAWYLATGQDVEFTAPTSVGAPLGLVAVA